MTARLCRKTNHIVNEFLSGSAAVTRLYLKLENCMYAKEKKKKKNHQQNTETGYYVHFQPELCEVFF